jgi:hypothetical protein
VEFGRYRGIADIGQAAAINLDSWLLDRVNGRATQDRMCDVAD